MGLLVEETTGPALLSPDDSASPIRKLAKYWTGKWNFQLSA